MSFIKANSGKGKRFPGGPTCAYKGVKVPCMCRWTEKGSITSEILRDIVKTLDSLDLFDRSNGKRPFFLLDGHGSRFELPFLQYINDKNHEWSACIGVPYGTSLWQVGDSEEQNGSYKMGLTRKKQDIMQLRNQTCAKPDIHTTDIIPMVNFGWDDSFADVDGNKNAISERGWNPFNMNLLLNKQIRATMTDEERENEKKDKEVIIPFHAKENFIEINDDLPTYDEKFLLDPKDERKNTIINTNTGVSAYCIDALVSHQDLMDSRNRQKKKRIDAKEEDDMLAKVKDNVGKLSAGNHFLQGNIRLGQSCLDQLLQKQDEADLNAKVIFENHREKYKNMLLKGQEAEDKFKKDNKWTNELLKSVIAMY